MATPTTLPATFVAGNVLTAAQMNDLRGAFRILQIFAVHKNDTFTTTSGTFIDLTGFSQAITPSSTSSTILIGYTVQASGLAANNMGSIQILRGSTAVGNAAAAGSRSVANVTIPELGAAVMGQVANWYLDSPNTTSATTYKLQIKSNNAGQTIVVNRTNTDTDSAVFGRSTSSFIVCEISA